MDPVTPRGDSPDPLLELDPDTSTPEQTEARYKLYLDAFERGRRLVAALRHPTQPRGHHSPVEDRYQIEHGQYNPEIRSLTDEAATYLRRENVNPNHLSYCEVTSIPYWKNHCALVKTAPRSGMLAVSELDRQFDYHYIWRTSLESRMSEILWKCWETAVTAQSLSPTLLRTVWIDYIVNLETKLVV
jgi:hypothetical protein